MQIFFGVLYLVTLLYVIAMFVRMGLGWLQVIVRDWRPSKYMAAFAEVIHMITDPPLCALRKVIPPLRIGAVALDLGFIIVMFALFMLMQVFQSLAGM